MKKLNITYWILTILFAAFMIFSAIPDILQKPDAVKFITDLGYPLYFITFIGVAKLLGSVVILIPAFPRLKEWAYAGLLFDLFGAFYSVAATHGITPSLPILVFMAMGFVSYYFHHKKLKVDSSKNG